MTSHFDLSAANDRLADLRPLLAGLREDRDAIARSRPSVEQSGAVEPAILARMEAAVRQIDAWGITLRDIATGLVDFPALASGRPIWLCWKLGEGAIAWWHELDAGFAARRPLIDLE